MPVPSNIIPMNIFKQRMDAHRAQVANIKVQNNFCYWCGHYATILIAKYWHGFCTEKCWKEYRTSRLGRR